MSSYPTPDLASILRTLSAYAPAPQPEAPQPYAPQVQAFPPLEDGELPYEPPYEPAELPYQVPTAPVAIYSQTITSPPPHEPQQPQAQAPAPAPTPQPQYPQQPPQKPALTQQSTIPSASTIITWPPALRHVTLHLVQNEEVMLRIKHLISTQHNHERQWWTQREALLKTQRGREEGRKKLDGVLSAVGGHIAPIKHIHDPQTEKAELERFDKKVYIACREMVVATTAELERLSVPFFRIQKGLVVGKGEKEEGKIDEEELQRLRMKMAGLLEDLCKD